MLAVINYTCSYMSKVEFSEMDMIQVLMNPNMKWNLDEENEHEWK